jgi:hypothetical protein
VLNGGDLTGVLKDTETYARGFLGCTAHLPVLNLGRAGPDTQATTNACIRCAEATVPQLKPIPDAGVR